MYRPPVPGAVTLARVLTIIESIIWLLFGVLFIVAGAALSGGGSGIFTDLNGNGSFGNLVGAAAGVLFAIGAVIIGLAVWGIWSGIAMGKLTGGPRISAIILSALGLALGLLDLVNSGTSTHAGQAALFGIIAIAVNAAIIYLLALAPASRQAYRAMTPGGYSAAPQMMYGAPPPPGQLPPGSGSYGQPSYGVPGYAQPGYGQQQYQPQYQPQQGYPEPAYQQPPPPQPPGYGQADYAPPGSGSQQPPDRPGYGPPPQQ